MISVIIPAHNEEAVVARTLRSLLDGVHPGEVEVIVVCNGCNDRTADVARAIGEPVRVTETEVASKIHALNLGDRAAAGFPRFYVDADVLISISTIRRMAGELSNGNVLAVAPRFAMDLAGCNWAVRAFYEINDRMPSSQEGIGGSGVYGLSAQGRARFADFPNITADDGFIRCLFKSQERRTLLDCTSTVFAPRTLRNLVKIKSRSHFGSYQLRQRFPQLWVNRGATNGKALKRLVANPRLWPKLTVYGCVKIAARLQALKQMRSGQSVLWERDVTSRQILALNKS